jgi:pimeloyl-ACP methyl ester carboxylesterase
VVCTHVVANTAAAAGGFLAANLAAHHPDSVRGVVLLNAAPFTSPYIPGRDLLLWRLLAAAADDSLPAPREVRQCRILRVWGSDVSQTVTPNSY